MRKKHLKVMIILLIFTINLVGIASQIGIQPTFYSNPRTIVNPLAQDYETNSSGSVDVVITTIEQGYKNESIVLIDQDNTSFTAPAPNATGYETSYAKISVKDIAVSNYTYIIEDDERTDANLIDENKPRVTSFTVPTSCYLTNASFDVRYQGSPDDLQVRIYNSSWSSIETTNKPAGLYDFTYLGNITVDSAGWKHLTDLEFYLNNSNTDNNTWYIGLFDFNTGSFDGYWYYNEDESSGDGEDETLSYEWTVLGWKLVTDNEKTIDFRSIVGLSLKNPTPAPTLINLQINGTSVSNNTLIPDNNSGIWENYNSYHGHDNELNFSITADWFSYSLSVNQTLVNYTSSFNAITTYTAESGVNVFWNATSEINKFDHRLENNTVNFTIPLSWNTPLSSLERDSSSIPSYSTYTNSTAKIITVRGINAIDGNWTLLTISSNLLSNIKIGVNGIESSYAYVNETLQFNATFSKAVTGTVNLSIYHPTLDDEMIFTNELPITDSDFIDLSTFDIDVENLATISDYGIYRVQVRWDNHTDVGIIDSTVVIAANTSVIVLTPPGHETLTIDSPYNISFQYLDEFKLVNVTGATIGYKNATGQWNSEVQLNLDESYNITINPADYSSGTHLIPITLNKTHYMNHTFTYEFNIVEASQIYKNLGDSILIVERGNNATFRLNYNRTSDEFPIEDANIRAVSINPTLEWSFMDLSGGDYIIEINTSAVDADLSPFNCIFNITLINATVGYQTQLFDFDLIVTVAQTSLSLTSQTDIIARNSGKNATINFHVEDTTNSMDLEGIPDSYFYVYNDSTSLLWDVGTFNWEVWEIGSGEYGVNISLFGLDYGMQTVRLNVSYSPNYNFSVLITSFYLRGNYTEIDIKEFNNNAGIVIPKVEQTYQIYLDTSEVGLILNLNDLENENQFISDSGGIFQYWAWFNDTQPLTTNFIYDRNNDENVGSITLPSGLNVGSGNITLTIGKKNYENATITFNVTFLEPIAIIISSIILPSVFTQTNATVVKFRVTYMNGTLQPLVGALIRLSSNRTDFVALTNTTDANGYVEFTVTVPSGRYNAMTFIVTYEGGAYGIGSGTQSYSVSVERARTISEWILYGVLIAVGLSLAVVAIQQGIVKPRKKKYRELLYNTVAVFEDAINLQHVLVIHKNTGTCVFFKTFGILDIDPDLISGFLSAAQSFVRESMSADGISEIKSGDNHLLISDGELVRVTLVLAKGASQFLRSNTARLVMLFENRYYEQLLNWRGALNVFQDAGPLIDETLHTSVILPHQITTSIKILKSIKSPLAQKLLKIARELTTAQRSFFFIAQLVSDAKDKLKKSPPEILLALNELLENEAISPVDISSYTEQPISEQEMNLLAQRVLQLPNLTNQERETLVKDLVRMNAAEREAALASIQQGQKITSDVSHRMITTKMFTSKKDAKHEISRLVKEANKMLKQNRFADAVLCYETASVTASNWKMPEESKKFRDKALNTQIAAFNNKIRVGKKEVPKLIRKGEEEEALNYCEEAYEAASSMFKLGFTEYEKTVKKFGGMLQEVRKKLQNYETSDDAIFKDDRKHYEKLERDVLKKAQKYEREKQYNEAVSAYSELTVIANKIFKFGVISAKDNIKKYKSKVAKLKRKALKATEEGLAQINEEALLDQKSQFLNIALEAEQVQDYLRAIVAYEEAIKIHHKLGDSDSATKLEEKIHSIVENIPNIEQVLKNLLESAENHYKQQVYDVAFGEYQYARGLCGALGKRDLVITINMKLDEISRKL
ncbi:MAG: hypothetical protein JW776_11485 [Candidatus Lokiarchaeota archaeon]|nr:hypothetical protein [Candidatus Lokiarchaeota archaeon]